MWTLLTSICTTSTALASRCLPYFFSAAVGALLLKNQGTTQSTGSHGILVTGHEVHTQIHQHISPQAPQATTSYHEYHTPLFLLGGCCSCLIYCLYAIKIGEDILQSPDSWANWSFHTQEQYDEDLFNDVQTKYLDIAHPETTLEPCITALHDIEKEASILHRYLRIQAILNKLSLSTFHHALYEHKAQTSISLLNDLSSRLFKFITCITRKEFHHETSNAHSSVHN